MQGLPVRVSERAPIQSLLLLCLMVFVALVITPVIGVGIASLIYPGDITESLINPAGHPEMRGQFLFIQAFASGAGLILIPWIYIRFVEHKSFSALVPLPRRPYLTILLLAFIGISFAIAVSPVIEWNAGVHFPDFMQGFEGWARSQEDLAAELTKEFTVFQTLGDLFVGLVVIALLPAIGEELVFRGLFQNEFRRWTGNPHVAIWLAACLFSAIHVQFFGFVPRLLLGALFGYLYYWSGSLLVPMFAHFFHNGFTVLMLYLYQHGQIAVDIDNNEAAPLSAVALTAVFVFLLLLAFRRIQVEEY